MKTKETGVHKSQNHLYNRVKPNPQTHTKPKDDKISIILKNHNEY